MGDNDKVKTRRGIPWLVHAVVVVLVVGGTSFFFPLLIPLLLKTFATFAALSTALFPICRRSWGLFLLNYLVSAVVAAALFFTT